MMQTWARENFAHMETLYHSANGYLGVRNAPEEGAADGVDSIRGTYINAFYEIKDIGYGEKLHGFPDTQQVMVNVPDAQTITLDAAGERFSMFSADVAKRQQMLDMQAGQSIRSCLWQSRHGSLRVEVRRMVSLRHQGLFLLRYKVESVDFAGSVRLTGILNADVRNHAAENDPRVAAEPLKCLHMDALGFDGDVAYARASTLRSGLTLCCRVAYRCPWVGGQSKAAMQATTAFEGALHAGESIELVQYAYYADSRRQSQPAKAAENALAECLLLDADQIEAQQREDMEAFWRDARVQMDGDEALQQAMDYNVYQLLQSTGSDGYSNIAAKGLSGEGYEGHTFWDSEIYIHPFFLWTQPQKARDMLLYRCNILERAKANARTLGFAKGALYPWRTINGDECSGYFPAGTAQYHIDGDIAYAFLQYWDATNDLDFMAAHGAKVLIETARLWLALGHMAEDGFRIECVTGPDEYTCLVDNNFYTNAAAQYNLRGAVRVMERLQAEGMDKAACNATGITQAELAQMATAAEWMYFPKEDKLGISPQDDTFLHKTVLDLESIPKENFPLLLHYHPLFLYRHQVCKQADTVLAHLLFPHTADEATKRRSYAYYQRVTTHDSSLSRCAYAMMAARLGMAEEAEAMFRETVNLDMADTHGNTRDGLHTANMGGAYLCILRGFAGVGVDESGLALAPILPKGWQGYAFTLVYQGRRIRCAVNAGGVKLTLLTGEPVYLTLNGQKQRLV